MQPKPAHLGLKYAEQFKDASIAEAYPHRPPYSQEAIERLIDLVTDEPRMLLDVGCGTGDLARRLAARVERVDAVDFSQAMLEKGKTLPGGDHPHLRWINGRVEEAELTPPYALITAGESLHWMEWQIVLPLFQRLLTPNGYLAIVGRANERVPWHDALQNLIDRFSTNREYRPYDLIEELEKRHLFQKEGSIHTSPRPFLQSGEAYIHSIHSRNGFSRERMGEEAAQTFDAEVHKVIAPYVQDGQLSLATICQIEWGRPLLSPTKSR